MAWALARWQEAVADHQAVARGWREVVDDRNGLDRETAGRLDALPELTGLRTRVPRVDARQGAMIAAVLWSGAPVVRAADLAALGDAVAVRAVWDQLDDVRRRSLIANEPAVTGNLDGVPIQFRAEANRLNMQAEIARIDRQLADVGTASIHNQLRAGETVEGLRAIRADLRYYLDSPQTVFDEDGLPVGVSGVPVVVFEPALGAIATYHGSFDAEGDVPVWVMNLAIHVPGTGTSLLTFRGTDTRADHLLRRAAAVADVTTVGPTAVFAWAGGRFPQSLDAAWDGYSRDLAPRLRDFAAAVDTRPGRSTLTVTGHSYGGAVVGMAEAAGLRADRILYVSGAGIGNGNRRVADFPHTGDVPHYALMARNDDVVGHIQGADVGAVGHGASPLRDPDVVRLETGFLSANSPVKGQDIESLGGTGSHSGVYTVGSTSFENIVQTIVGGRVETFAEDRVLRVRVPRLGMQTEVVDGIDRDDYAPRTTEVR